ncbi:unnamed protein product [Gongylonema pulchrum]|uniref:LRRCT domain-containing protein n=1 Tax=Gongylonema pulchrum TaxID=637853 RepID=A0A183DS55_9BILA|nr:unnamed protein product [Gongylonema pulchrum]
MPESSCSTNTIFSHYNRRKCYNIADVNATALVHNSDANRCCHNSEEHGDNKVGRRKNQRIVGYYHNDEDNDDEHENDDDDNGCFASWYGGMSEGEPRQRLQHFVVVKWQRQYFKEVSRSDQFVRSFVLFIALCFGVSLSSACPEIISTICRCDDSHHGIVLRCSHSDGAQAVQLLRANQINLGLIQQLELQNSGLHHIPAGFFSGLFIKKLDLSHNSIADIDENGFLGMSSVLQELILHHNNLTRLPAKALVPLSALLRLDLSNNSIGNIEAEDAIPPLSKLYDINLANNRICLIQKNAFDDVKYTVQTINLGKNCLKEVPAPAIRGFKQLMALHLHSNNITALEALSFMNLPLMNLLNLASNLISDVHKQAFLNVPNLRFLYLTGNQITEIRPRQFASFGQLEMVDLTGNQLTKLQAEGFSDLQNIRQLYLGDNRIDTIEPRCFTNSSVIILVLSKNNLKELRKGMFDGLDKMQQLVLKDNQAVIQFIDQNSFYSNPSLAMIDLSNNKLMDIPPSTFLAQINLFLIDLSGNKLLRTPYGAFSRRVKTVLLQENPLVCSERVHMLQQGVGIYVASSADAVCRPNKLPAHNLTNAANSAVGESAAVDSNAKTQLEEKVVSFKTPAIIRPFSTIENEVTKSLNEAEDQSNIERMTPVRPVNALVNAQPVAVPRPSQRPSMGELPELGVRNLGSDSETGVEKHGPRRNDNSRKPEDPGTNNKTGSVDGNQILVEDTKMIQPLPTPFRNRPITYVENMLTTDRTSRKQTVLAPTYIDNNTLTAGWASRNQTVSRVETLPPSIVIADSAQDIDRIGLLPPVPESNQIEAVAVRDAEENGAPSVIIMVCLCTVIVVMCAVFIGLSIARYRRMGIVHGSMTTNSSAAARTNAYVAAQLDMIYGTVQRNRNADGQPWIYAPDANASYYK